MVECPICHTTSRAEESLCEGCGVPSGLAGVVLEIAGPAPKPELARVVAELIGAAGLEVVTDTPAPPSLAATVPPATRMALGPPPSAEVTPTEPDPSDGLAATGKNVEELLEIADALGLDTGQGKEASEKARKARDRRSLQRVRRELFHEVSSRLVEQYGALREERDRLRQSGSAPRVEADLQAYRRALGAGDLGEANRRRMTVGEYLGSLRGPPAPVAPQRVADTELMVRTLREMGGIPKGTLRQVVTALSGGQATPRPSSDGNLGQVNQLLWKLLSPRLAHEISKLRGSLESANLPADRSELIGRELTRMADHLRRHELGEVIDSYRFIRLAVPKAPRSERRTGFG